jgi:hypothetical protein
MGIPVANVWQAPPTMKIKAPYRMVFFLPITSPMRPVTSEDTSAPTSRIATIVPISALEGWLK